MRTDPRDPPSAPSDATVEMGEGERTELLDAPRPDAADSASAMSGVADARSGERLLVPGERLGPYRVESLLGKGGMGRVYRATHTGLERAVALKVLAPEVLDHPEAVDRFLAEARAMAKCDHPNVVRVYDVGEMEGVHYISMEYVEGEDLSQIVDEGGRLDPGWAVQVLTETARGLAAVHAAGVLHGDLKPSNILISRRGRAMLLDFGLAKRRGDEPGSAGRLFGTVLFLPPERFLGKPYDEKSDLYALGASFFWCLSRRFPFPGETLADVRQAIAAGPAPLLCDLDPRVPGPLSLLVARLVERDPDRRIASAEEALAEIERLSSSRSAAGARREKAGRVIGIDLGTTYSAVSTLDDAGRPLSLGTSSGLTMPSAVFIDEGGEIFVGAEARRLGRLAPDRLVVGAKREMGRPGFRFRAGGLELPPESISALVLRRILADVEPAIGPVGGAVVTVPAYFDDARRRATLDAARIAGLPVLDLVNEPTAAALSAVVDRPPAQDEKELLLVYDLGGGTFDVTLVETDGTDFRVVATDGDSRLGGIDWDLRLADLMAEAVIAAGGPDPRRVHPTSALLAEEAEETKKALSSRLRATVRLQVGTEVFPVEVTRAAFEARTADLLARTKATASLLVRQAGREWSCIDRVVLVGGSCRMPMVPAMLAELAGKQASSNVSLDHAVAHGAAIHAALVAGRRGGEVPDALADISRTEVTAHSLGVVAKNRGKIENVVLIPRNTAVPCSVSRVLGTVRADQSQVKVICLQGESTDPESCVRLGEFELGPLPPGLPKGSPVQLTYTYGEDGVVRVEGIEITSGASVRATAGGRPGLSQVEIEAEAKRVRDWKLE
ncbi:MAG: Hsp70 family protein [Planctomycetes bacterium]|nr:Hsp70 family protein [Planctomycetota bacterium]